MKKHLLLFILLSIVMGCNTKQKKSDDNDEIICNDKFFPNDSSKLFHLISVIESSKYVEREYIGATGKKSYIYECYEELLKNASDSLWVELTHSKSAVMRWYAYTALQSKGDSTIIVEVRNRLIKDTANIANLAKVFMECSRVLKKDGTMWIVIGDSYAGSGRGWSGKNDLYSRKVLLRPFRYARTCPVRWTQ